MYLSDEELQKLAQNMLRWLRDDGHLFFRESCYHSSGDMKNSDNPTVYRTPQMYTDLFSAVNQQESDDVTSRFEVVTKRAVEAYAKVIAKHQERNSQTHVQRLFNVLALWQKLIKLSSLTISNVTHPKVLSDTCKWLECLVFWDKNKKPLTLSRSTFT